MKVLFKKLDNHAKIPTRTTKYDAGYDLYALTGGTIEPHEKQLIKTGISIRMPVLAYPFQVYASVRSRSGLSLKYSLEVGAGVVDFGYDKEIGVILYNHSSESFSYNQHDRIAQLVLEVIITPDIAEVDDFDELEHNDRLGGFGSSGK